MKLEFFQTQTQTLPEPVRPGPTHNSDIETMLLKKLNECFSLQPKIEFITLLMISKNSKFFREIRILFCCCAFTLKIGIQ